MDSELDVVTAVSAICVAGYAAIAIDYVARFGLGLPLHQIRGGALIVSVAIAALIAIDFFGRTPDRAK